MGVKKMVILSKVQMMKIVKETYSLLSLGQSLSVVVIRAATIFFIVD